MRKSDKKIENQLRVMLTEVCEQALKNYSGFVWLTHLVNYSDFPKSLKIICVFDTNASRSLCIKNNDCLEMGHLIQKRLFELNINFKNITNHIVYDTEEDCHKSHQGKWADRFESYMLKK